MKTTDNDPHANQPVLTYGIPLDQARAVMLMVHGRGASAEDILSLAEELDVPGFAYFAPQAAGFTWYPQRFLAPLEANQPWLDSALETLNRVMDQIQGSGISAERIMLLGFSQGACLTLEYAARHSRRYAGVVGLSGGLIGPQVDAARYYGNFSGTPVFLGCSDTDPHIPQRRVIETDQTLRQLGAEVDMRLYPGMGHTINEDELEAVRGMMVSI